MRIRPAAVVLAVLTAALAAGCADRAPSEGRQVDPAVRAAAAVTGLERTELPVTKEQAAQLLPLFRALRGTPAQDRPAVSALVRQIDGIVTDAQRAAVRRLREQRQPGGPPPDFGAGAPPGGEGRRPSRPPGVGRPSAEGIAAFRGQILDRAIAVLEDRAL
jgi:hypothetical protein